MFASARSKLLARAAKMTRFRRTPAPRSHPLYGALPALELLEQRVLYSVGSDSLLSTNPFGISSSGQSIGTFANWAPSVHNNGAGWVRLFPEWNGIESTDNGWNHSSIDSVLSTAAANNLYVSGVFAYSASWVNANQHTLPVNNLAAWADYISHTVNYAKDSVKYWEIWNEPNSPAFSTSASAAEYAATVVAAYNAAKAADPNCKIGLTVAEADVNFLSRVIQAGAADHFDFIAVHPYAKLAAVENGFEAQFMSTVPTIRKMLAERNPAKVNVPIWFTEIGSRIGDNVGGQTVTETSQAEDLVKTFAMGLSQGAQRIDWYEGRDFSTNTSDYLYGFGLSTANGTPRMAANAYHNITTYLGTNPQYLGWAQVNSSGDIGYLFNGATGNVMITWAKNGPSHSTSFSPAATVINPMTGASGNYSSYSLTNSPVIVTNVPSSLVSAAQANIGKSIPWGGNFAGAPSVSLTAGNPNNEQGLHQLFASNTSTYVSGVGRNCSPASIQRFAVDPAALSYSHNIITISATVRRVTAGTNTGFNLKYESTSGFKNSSYGWYTVPADTNWHTVTWTLTDAEFNSTWGYNFVFDSDSTGLSKYYLKSLSVNIELLPEADAAVRGGTYVSQNFGNDPSFYVKNDSDFNYDRDAFLRFDLSNFSAPVGNALLNLPIVNRGADVSNMIFEVRLVAEDNWTESGVTWNARPATSTVLATIYGSSLTGDSLSIDLTSIVNSTILGDKKLSIALIPTNASGADRWVEFGSAENSNPLLRPGLQFFS